MHRILRLSASTALAVGCARDPAAGICPDIGVGDLVVTEVRGPQTGGDTWGQWIELYNASPHTLDLEGVVVDLRSIDGQHDLRLLVRRSLPLAAGSYAALGNFDDDTRPAHVAYGFGADFSSAFPTAGGITVTACDVTSDRVVFGSLPSMGSWSLGEMPPTAAGNDDAAAWCNDTTPSTDATMLGLPGTPGATNHPCP